jgi:UPF0176 protein
MYTVSAFYQFHPFPTYAQWQEPLYKECLNNGIKGSILLAGEGINGTIAGPEEGIDAVLTFLRTQLPFASLQDKRSFAAEFPFKRLKIKLKKEIVTMGLPQVDPGAQVGIYVKPEKWNELIQDPEMVVIDVRNDYEVEEGTFKGSIDPKTPTFRDFPQYVKDNLTPERAPKVALFCTGGIRCEKASSYMLSEGFQEVYHLEGGILKYLEAIPPQESLWEGGCFIFDDREALAHGLVPQPRERKEGHS